MSKFKVKEIAVFIPGENTSPLLALRKGEDVEIIDPLGTHDDWLGTP